MPSNIDAVLFDLDSTLTDRSASILKYAVLFRDHFASRLRRQADVADLATTIEKFDENGYLPRLKTL